MPPTSTMNRLKKENPQPMKDYLEKISTRWAAKPEDIADAVLFLAYSESDAIIGQEIKK